MKRYNLVMPQELFDEVERVAMARGTTTADLLRRFTKLGLMVIGLEDVPDSKLFIRENGKQTRIKFL